MDDRTLNTLTTKLEEIKQQADNNWDKAVEALAHLENAKHRDKRYREEIRRLEAEIERLKKI